MKKVLVISYILLVLVVMYSCSVFAAQLPVPDQEFPGISNKLVNPGFENGKYGWTASGGATAAANTTAKGEGSYGYDWDSNGASQTLISNAITVPAGLFGKNGLAYCKIKTPSGSATHTIVVDDGTNPLVTAQTISTSSSTFAIQALNFLFPSSGSVRLKLTSVNANEPEIYIDSCYLGEASNVQQISQTQLAGESHFAGTASCTWTRSSATLGAVATVAACPGPTVTLSNIGTWAATDSDLPQQTITNLPPGTYRAKFHAYLLAPGADRSYATVSDGSTSCHAQGVTGAASAREGNIVECTFVYTTTQASKTFALHLANTGAGAVSITNSDTAPSGGTKFTLERFPSSTEIAYRPELINWRVDANISGAHASLSSTDVSAYTEITNSGLTLTNNSGNGVVAAQVPCSTTNAPSGTTCSAGDESIGVSFTLPAAGDVMACVSFSHFAMAGASGLVHSVFQIVETPSNAQTISQEGKSRVHSGINAASTGGMFPHRLCGTFTFSSAGQKTLRLMYEQNITATVTTNQIQADAATDQGQRDIHWEVYPINQAIPAPVLVGSVTSTSTGAMRIESVRLAGPSGGACAVSNESGDWISGTPTSGAVQTCTAVINTGIFSATPVCTCSPEIDGRICDIVSVTTTGFSTHTYVHDGSASGAARSIICMGPQ